MTTCARRWTRRSMGTNLGTPRFWLNLKKWGKSPQPTRTKGIKWSHPPGSNRRPTDYESVALPAELGWPSGLRLKRSARFGTLLCDDNTMVIGPRLAVPIALAMLGSCRTPGPAAAIDPALSARVPAATVALAGVDLDRLRASP